MKSQIDEMRKALEALKVAPLRDACARWEQRLQAMEKSKRDGWRLAPHLPPLEPEDRTIFESLFQTAQDQHSELSRQMEQAISVKAQLETRLAEVEAMVKRLNVVSIARSMSGPDAQGATIDMKSIQKSLTAGRQSVYQANALLKLTEKAMV